MEEENKLNKNNNENSEESIVTYKLNDIKNVITVLNNIQVSGEKNITNLCYVFNILNNGNVTTHE